MVDVGRGFLVLAPLVAVFVRGKRHGPENQIRGVGDVQFLQVHGFSVAVQALRSRNMRMIAMAENGTLMAMISCTIRSSPSWL